MSLHPVIQLLAQIARAEPARLDPSRTLGETGLGSSLGLSVLRSAWKRKFGRALPAVTVRTTVGELLANHDAGVMPGESSPMTTAPVLTSGQRISMKGPFGGRLRESRGESQVLPGHGVDIEEVESMPAWPPADSDGGFYQDHFTPDELARAAAHAAPREHLAGVWCAKEAVKKAAPELMALGWHEIELTVTADGRPVVAFAVPTAWRVTVSISHTRTCAVASVLAWPI